MSPGRTLYVVCTRQVSAGLGVLGARGCCSPSPRMLYCSTRTLKTPLRMLKPPLKMLKPPLRMLKPALRMQLPRLRCPGAARGCPKAGQRLPLSVGREHGCCRELAERCGWGQATPMLFGRSPGSCSDPGVPERPWVRVVPSDDGSADNC